MASSYGQLPRCCPRHDDWASLGAHLAADFAEVSPPEVGRELARAREATELVALEGDDALFIGELITRHQLMLRSGRLPEVARLDPESHSGRRRLPDSTAASAASAQPKRRSSGQLASRSGSLTGP